MDKRYAWASGAPFSSRLAQPFGEWLRTQADKSPKGVVTAAKREGRACPVYAELWGTSDRDAALRWRVTRAGHLLRSLVEAETGTREVLALKTKRGGGKALFEPRRWVQLSDVRKRADVEAILMDMVADLDAFQRRYQRYKHALSRRLPALRNVFISIARVERQARQRRAA